MAENNKKNIENFINYCINDENPKYKLALFLILKKCAEDTELKKEQLIEKLKTMHKNDEIESLYKISSLNKQYLKQFIILEEESRSVILEKIIKRIELLESNDGFIDFSKDLYDKDEKNSTTRMVQTKDANIVLNMNSEYVTIDRNRLALYAQYNNDLDIEVRTFHYKTYSGLDEWGKRYKVYKDIYEDKLLKSYINELNHKVLELKQINSILVQDFNGKIRSQNGLDIFYKKHILTLEYDGINKEKNEKSYYNLSIVKIDGKACRNEVILLVINQSCNFINYEKYKNIINENIKNIMFKHSDNSVDLQIEDDTLGKIIIKEDGRINCKKIENETIINKYTIPISLGFDFELEEFNKFDFEKNKEKYLNNLKIFLSEKTNIEDRIQAEVFNFLNQSIEQITSEYTKIDINTHIHISEQDNISMNVSFSAEKEDDEEDGYIDMGFNCNNKEVVYYESGNF